LTVVSKLLRTETEGHGEIVDLTAGLRSILSDGGVKDGLMSVFAIGSTVVGGELALGTWQQVVLVDFDDRPRQRTVAVHLVS